jgi:arylsulfatase A-like enzyme
LINGVKEKGVFKNTYIVFMGDNGWFLGEHRFTSKVLAYEESVHVPMFIIGPGINPGTSDAMVLNIDVLPTMLELANLPVPANIHGKSLVSLLNDPSTRKIREFVYYEAPVSQLGSKPIFAVWDQKWKYIQTCSEQNHNEVIFEELYHLEQDPFELNNLAFEDSAESQLSEMKNLLSEKKESIK